MPSPIPTTPALNLQSVSKRYPGVTALDNVNISIGHGEIVGLIGENGAGKSTLVKILAGVVRPDSGRIFVDSREVMVRTAADALGLRIGVVHQEPNLVDNLDVAGNLFLGREPARMRWAGPLRWVDKSAMDRLSRPLLQRMGLTLSPRTSVANLPIAQRQMVEIARAISLDAKMLVLDEPTSSLSAAETKVLLSRILELRGQGVSVLFISHRLDEISQIADRVVALRDGRNAGELPRGQIDHDRMVRLMIGRELAAKSTSSAPSLAKTSKRLQVRDLRTTAWPNQAVSFEADGGEILGFAGLVGCGRSELARAIFGVDPMPSGDVLLDGRLLRIRRPKDAIDAGIYLVPEDRRRDGLIAEMNVRENISLPDLQEYCEMGLIRLQRERYAAREQARSLRIKMASTESSAMTLSGGNQQKVVLAKWLNMRPKVLIVDEPTRGIDVGAKSEIHQLLRDLAALGVAVVMISSDLEEILAVSDRLAVMREGAIAGTLSKNAFSERAVMDLAFGSAAPNGAAA